MDDIVTRLRKAVCWCNDFDGRCETCQAADEIERLRRGNDWYKAVNNQLHSDLAGQHEDKFITYLRLALEGENNDLR